MLKGTVSLVTGAASGLGRATAERLLKAGGRVALLDLPASKGQQVADELGDSAMFIPADVRNEEDVKSGIESIDKRFSCLHHVINCAGIAAAFMTYGVNTKKPMHLDTFTDVIMVNTIGTFNVCRLSVDLMQKNSPDPGGQRGVIVNVGSVAATEGQTSQAAFSASKAAVSAMTLPMARDLACLGIRVVCVSPGHFLTPLTQQWPEKVVNFFSSLQTFPKRLGKSEEFSEFVVNVISNPLLNGEELRLDGGLRMHYML